MAIEKQLEQTLLAQTQSAKQIPDKIVIEHLTQYFQALSKLFEVEEKGLSLSAHSPKKSNPRKKS